jgi:hypothetical protein
MVVESVAFILLRRRRRKIGGKGIIPRQTNRKTEVQTVLILGVSLRRTHVSVICF